jgi:enterochelin esterase family protein
MLAHAALLLIGMTQSDFNLDMLEPLMASDPAAAAKLIRARFPKDQLGGGIQPYVEGTRVLFAAEMGAGMSVVDNDMPPVKTVLDLKQLDENLAAGIKTFHDGDALRAIYYNGRPASRPMEVEVYDRNPFTELPAGGMKGELRAMGELKSKTFPGTTRQWFVYLPPGFDKSTPHPVLIGCDAQWDRQWMANALENCAAGGMIPPTVGVFIEPGQDKPGSYSNRSKEYDSLNGDYSKFLLEEILPEVEKIVPLSHKPEDRAVTGMSSGGICSFTSCWEHPDQFGTAISFVGSFANIASGESKREGGHNYPFLIRKMEKKPIRVFLQDGANDLNNDHGDWWICNQQMQSALKYKGYDVVWVPGKGFHNTKHARRIFDQALAWWRKPT